MVDALKKPNPWAEGKDVKVVEVLDQAEAGLEKGFAGSRATEGALRDAVGRSYKGLGFYAKASRCTGRRWPYARRPSGRRTAIPSIASPTRLGALGRRPAIRGPGPGRGDVRRQREAVGFDDPDTLETSDRLGKDRALAGRTAEAIEGLQRSYRRQDRQPRPRPSRHALQRLEASPSAYREAGRRAEQAALAEAVAKAYEAKLGPDQIETLASRNSLATGLCCHGSIRRGGKEFGRRCTRRTQAARAGPSRDDRDLDGLANVYLSAGWVSGRSRSRRRW